MAIVKGLSLQFRGGRIAHNLIFGSWKGIEYIRLKPFPRYQRTEKQAICRNRFADAVKAYQQLDQTARMLWRMLATNTGMSGYEYFLKKYISTHL